MEKIMFVGDREVRFNWLAWANQYEVVIDGWEQVGFTDDPQEMYYVVADMMLKGSLTLQQAK